VPEPPVEPEPPQTGDAAIYATIAVAVAAVALAVVFKKRATI
ncbi:MAG: LPXTG cell wall anchor domain-containing protein, partial [Ruminococcaceae bacterium]|nr:LPXTG cell wall anchor domain-containing protein [Oscillospiraceae bacterium]